MTKRPPSICVYCGSRNGEEPAYLEAAQQLGQAIGAEGWSLVYGAGDVGLMGKVADAANESGARTLGVIPGHLVDMEVAKSDLSQLIVTETMHERKKVMFMNADAVVILPGGAGTLDEFFEVLTWRQLGLHTKPIIVLNAGGYWSPLLELIDHVISQGFAAPSLREFIQTADTAVDAMALLRAALTPSNE